MRINYVRIPMLEVMLALSHFYLNDEFGEKMCLQNDPAIYKLYYLPFEKISKVSMTWKSQTLHIAKKRTYTSLVTLFIVE